MTERDLCGGKKKSVPLKGLNKLVSNPEHINDFIFDRRKNPKG
jgi:hypothetical protein